MHMNYERAHNEARSRANAKARHFETRSKRVSLDLAIMRMDAYALIAWLKASIINGWLGTPVLNTELAKSAARDRQLDRTNKHEFIQHLTVLKRLRLGYVGGGRVPHRTRGAPPPRRDTTATR